MTRFSASGPRISYTPIEGPKPFKQIVGLYNMWQSLSPDTRNWIASLFSGKDKPAETVSEIENPELQMAGYDPNLDMSMTREDQPPDQCVHSPLISACQSLITA